MMRLLVLLVAALFAVQPALAETIKINLHSCCVTEDGGVKLLSAVEKNVIENTWKKTQVR
jgi:hypothetical protein